MAEPRTIFVSRTLTAESPLYQQLTAAGHRVTGRSLLRFDPVPFVPPPATDWIFFYSSRAVRFFLAGRPESSPVLSRLATIGPGTAATLRELLREPDFIGSGKPVAVAAAFAERVGRGSVLFPRARRSRRSVQARLPAHISVVDLVVYDNAVAPDQAVPATDVAILTSPLNAEAYLAALPAPAGLLVAIGPSTAGLLREKGYPCLTADQPDENTLAQLILRTLN